MLYPRAENEVMEVKPLFKSIVLNQAFSGLFSMEGFEYELREVSPNFNSSLSQGPHKYLKRIFPADWAQGTLLVRAVTALVLNRPLNALRAHLQQPPSLWKRSVFFYKGEINCFVIPKSKQLSNR